MSETNKQNDAQKEQNGVVHNQTDQDNQQNNSNKNDGDGANAEKNQPVEHNPSMNILAQYVKDFSFENPNAPQSLAKQDANPKIDISVNVAAKGMAQDEYETELKITAKASIEETSVFIIELIYAGVFRLKNVPQDMLQPALLIECPRMLFPFARHILADATRNGGYMPLMLDPIDFAGLYQQRMQQQKEQLEKNQQQTAQKDQII